jgi:hypothetical protein
MEKEVRNYIFYIIHEEKKRLESGKSRVDARDRGKGLIKGKEAEPSCRAATY